MPELAPGIHVIAFAVCSSVWMVPQGHGVDGRVKPGHDGAGNSGCRLLPLLTSVALK